MGSSLGRPRVPNTAWFREAHGNLPPASWPHRHSLCVSLQVWPWRMPGSFIKEGLEQVRLLAWYLHMGSECRSSQKTSSPPVKTLDKLKQEDDSNTSPQRWRPGCGPGGAGMGIREALQQEGPGSPQDPWTRGELKPHKQRPGSPGMDSGDVTLAAEKPS